MLRNEDQISDSGRSSSVVVVHHSSNSMNITTKKKNNARKRNDLTVDKKLQIIEDFTNGSQLNTILKKYNINQSHLSSIIRRKNAILRDYQTYGRRQRKRIAKRTKYAPINEEVYTWLISLNCHVSGSIIQNKAKSFAEQLNISGFRASNGWLECFRKKYNIHSYREHHSTTIAATTDINTDGKNTYLPNNNNSINNTYLPNNNNSINNTYLQNNNNSINNIYLQNNNSTNNTYSQNNNSTNNTYTHVNNATNHVSCKRKILTKSNLPTQNIGGGNGGGGDGGCGSSCSSNNNIENNYNKSISSTSTDSIISTQTSKSPYYNTNNNRNVSTTPSSSSRLTNITIQSTQNGYQHLNPSFNITPSSSILPSNTIINYKSMTFNNGGIHYQPTNYAHEPNNLINHHITSNEQFPLTNSNNTKQLNPNNRMSLTNKNDEQNYGNILSRSQEHTKLLYQNSMFIPPPTSSYHPPYNHIVDETIAAHNNYDNNKFIYPIPQKHDVRAYFPTSYPYHPNYIRNNFNELSNNNYIPSNNNNYLYGKHHHYTPTMDTHWNDSIKFTTTSYNMDPTNQVHLPFYSPSEPIDSKFIPYSYATTTATGAAGTAATTTTATAATTDNNINKNPPFYPNQQRQNFY